MSTLAKILVIINLVLSVAFFGVTSTLFMVRKNWRASYEELRTSTQAELAEQIKSFEPYKTSMGNMRTENRGLLEARNNLQSENNQLKEQIQNLTSEKESLTEANKEQLALLKKQEENNQRLNDNIANLNSQNETLRNERQKAVSDKQAAVVAYTSLSIDLSKTQEELTNARADLQESNQQVEKFEIMIAAAEKNGYKLDQFQQPQINGVIDAVSNEENIVVISVGKDQKVEHGHVFAVRRGGDYIGKIEVTDVYQDLSGARVIYTKENTNIQVGDTIETFRS